MESNKKERKAGLVRLRGGFSDTSGVAPRNKEIQLEEFDDDTRIKICNRLYSVLQTVFDNPSFFL